MSAGLRLAGVSVHLSGRPVVTDVALALPPGTLTAIVGPNGAGKTSLLRALAGVLPYLGTLHLGSRDLAGAGPRERARLVSYLPQGHEAHWPLPARDIVALGRLPHGAGDPARLSAPDRDAVEAALARVDALHLADRPVTALSGGERARVALARVLAVGAPVLLADEPTAALDPRHQLAVMATLRAMARGGTIVVAVTHDLGLAARFADRVLVMAEGRVAAFDAPALALSPALLRAVFGIAAFSATHEGEPVLVPWG